MTRSLSTSHDRCPIPSGVAIRGTVKVPSSKSLTQRFLNLAFLARQPVVLEDPLRSEDTELFATALSRAGYEVLLGDDSVEIGPGLVPASSELFCGNNGTMLRFLTASLTTTPGVWRLDGSDRLRKRPLGPLVEALRQLGAQIEFLEEDGFAPLRIQGGSLVGGRAELDAGLSSQFASAILMAATAARQPVELRAQSLTSAPYVDLTLDTLDHFQARVESPEADTWRVSPGPLRGGRWTMEGDFSAAAYPAAAAALTAGRVRIEGVSPRSKQGDRRFLEVLARMGARVEWLAGTLQVIGPSSLQAVEVDFSDMPDQVPTLAALAPFAVGTTTIDNVPHLRLKESDRLAAMATELRRLGADLDEMPAGLQVRGSWAEGPVPSSQTQVDTYGDHRIAMSLAIC
ncbi:MAG: 3-phosphoshikimate 1-carboxyvinyltransferase, partial [Thermoanaerobaculia bacterium]